MVLAGFERSKQMVKAMILSQLTLPSEMHNLSYKDEAYKTQARNYKLVERSANGDYYVKRCR